MTKNNAMEVVVPANATTEEKFNILYNLNLSDKIEKRDGLSYLSWAHAVKLFRTYFPNGTYSIIKNPVTGLPYFNDPNIGLMVMTEVTIDGISQGMWLPVMDNKKKAMKEEAYTYQVWDNYTKQFVEKTVNKATMTDINSALQRCLTKNIAVCTGIGLALYTNEDIEAMDIQQAAIPDNQQQIYKAPATPVRRTFTPRSQQVVSQPQQQYDPYKNVREALASAKDMNTLMVLYQQYKSLVDSDPNVKSMFSQAKININKVA